MKKINILILVDKFDYHGSYINGPTRSYSWLLKTIDPKKFNVRLCVLRDRGFSDTCFREENIHIDYLNLGKYSVWTLFVIMKIIRQERIDVLHLTGYGATTFGRIAGTICRTPSIVHERWVDPNISRMQILLEKVLSRYTNMSIAVSAYARDFLTTKKGIHKDKVALIPNGIPLKLFMDTSEEEGKRKRAELGISIDVTTIGIVGMLDENKGHRHFIEAASYVSRVRADVQFLIIGDGELRGHLEHMVAKLNLESSVKFVGHQREMPEVLRALDVFVIASISESFSLSLLEAMASQRPIITTDCGGPSEIIEDTWSGLVVPVKDARSIADKIVYLLDNPSVCMRIAENAKKECEKYDIEFTGKQIQDLYLKVYDSQHMNGSSPGREKVSTS